MINTIDRKTFERILAQANACTFHKADQNFNCIAFRAKGGRVEITSLDGHKLYHNTIYALDLASVIGTGRTLLLDKAHDILRWIKSLPKAIARIDIAIDDAGTLRLEAAGFRCEAVSKYGDFMELDHIYANFRDTQAEAVFNGKELIDALKLCKPYINQACRAVYFDFDENKGARLYVPPYKPVIRHANKPNFEHDGFSLDMPCLYRGEIRKHYRGDIINRIVYPWSNLLELVRLTPGKKVHFQFTTEAGPSKILGEDENSFYVLMPMKVSDDIEQEDETETEAAA